MKRDLVSPEKRRQVLAFVPALLLAAGSTAAVGGGGSGVGQGAASSEGKRIRADLTGYEEVPPVSTPARGTFRGTISEDRTSIEYELTYSGLQGAVTQAHIHFAQKGVNGGIIVWLCGTTARPGPAGTPSCPQSGTVSGTITANEVVGSADTAQQLGPGELEEVLAAIRVGRTYVNVHSTLSPGGEIRGQIRTRRDHKRGGDGH
jgi:hypothetical protein